MRVTFEKRGRGERVKEGLTLAEQKEEWLFLSNEDGEYEKKISGGTLETVRNCRTVGVTNFDKDIVSSINDEYLDEPVEGSAYFAPVKAAEQRGEDVVIQMEDGRELTFRGELDRAYTY